MGYYPGDLHALLAVSVKHLQACARGLVHPSRRRHRLSRQLSLNTGRTDALLRNQFEALPMHHLWLPASM